MNHRDEILDEIRALRSGTSPDWATTPSGQRVMARAIAMGESATMSQKPTAQRTRHVVIAGISVGALLVTGVAAAAAVRQANSPTQVGCYETLSPQADTTEAERALVTEVGPVAACRQTWVELSKPIDVSNLVSCVNSHGGRGVFPAPRGTDAPSACNQIGWAVDAG
jgi:hypothetical protein